MNNPFKAKPDAEKQAMIDSIQAYRKLETLGLAPEFQEYSKLLTNTVANKMIWAFTSNKIKSWEDFCEVRGEIHARLQPLQEVRESGALARHLQEQLDEYYNKEQA